MLSDGGSTQLRGRRFAIGVASLGCLIFAIQIHAQSQAQIDFNTARSDAALGTSSNPTTLPSFGSLISSSLYPFAPPPGASPLTVQPFTLNAALPAGYYEADSSKGSATGAQTIPEIKVGFMVHADSSRFQVSGFIDSASARYSQSTPSGGDKLSGSLRVDFVEPVAFPDRGALIPYVSYAPQEAFTPFYSTRKTLTQDFTIGANKLWDFNPDWSSQSTVAKSSPAWEVGLQIATQRRVADPTPNSTAVIVGPSVKWAYTNAANFFGVEPEDIGALAISLACNVTRRWFDQYQGSSEEDLTVTPIATAAWVLPAKWFGSAATRFGAPELDFQIAFNDVSSNIAGNSNRQWGIGPALKTAWRF